MLGLIQTTVRSNAHTQEIDFKRPIEKHSRFERRNFESLTSDIISLKAKGCRATKFNLRNSISSFNGSIEFLRENFKIICRRRVSPSFENNHMTQRAMYVSVKFFYKKFQFF